MLPVKQVFLLSFVLVFASPIVAAPLSLQFGERTVIAKGVRQGGAVVLFGIAKEPSQSMPPMPLKATHSLLLRDDDGDGSVVFDREAVIPRIAVWIAVDLSTGGWAAAGSPGFDARQIPLQELAKHDNAGQLRKLLVTVPEMDVLLVRPGEGAWSLYAAKSSSVDENARGERPLKIDISRMVPLSDFGPPPNSLHKGDIVAIIEPRSMRYLVEEVGK